MLIFQKDRVSVKSRTREANHGGLPVSCKLPLAGAIVPTTLTYAARIVPLAGKKFNVDFGVAQAAGHILPGVNLYARHQFALGISYGL